jgi:hypothetical protein
LPGKTELIGKAEKELKIPEEVHAVCELLRTKHNGLFWTVSIARIIPEFNLADTANCRNRQAEL